MRRVPGALLVLMVLGVLNQGQQSLGQDADETLVELYDFGDLLQPYPDEAGEPKAPLFGFRDWPRDDEREYLLPEFRRDSSAFQYRKEITVPEFIHAIADGLGIWAEAEYLCLDPVTRRRWQISAPKPLHQAMRLVLAQMLAADSARVRIQLWHQGQLLGTAQGRPGRELRVTQADARALLAFMDRYREFDKDYDMPIAREIHQGMELQLEVARLPGGRLRVQGCISRRELKAVDKVEVQGGTLDLPESRDAFTPFAVDLPDPGVVTVTCADGMQFDVHVACGTPLVDLDEELADGTRLMVADVSGSLLRRQTTLDVFAPKGVSFRPFSDDGEVRVGIDRVPAARTFLVEWQRFGGSSVIDEPDCMAIWAWPPGTEEYPRRLRQVLSELRRPAPQVWRLRLWETAGDAIPVQPPGTRPLAELNWRVIEGHRYDQFAVNNQRIVAGYLMPAASQPVRDVYPTDHRVGVAASLVVHRRGIEASLRLGDAAEDVENFDTKAGGKGTVIVQRQQVRTTELRFSGSGRRLEAAVMRDGHLLYGLLERLD